MTELLSLLHPASAWAAILSATLLGGLLAYNLKTPSFGFWPAASGWRHNTAFGIFRVFCGMTVGFALTEIWAHGWGHWLRYALGVPFTFVAFGITLWGYRFLGLDNTYCEADGLGTGGMYAYSRNPQYVTSVLATVGLGIVAASPLTLVFAAVLFVLYFLFILNEERWLAEGYGRAFLDYMASTPRFIDERSFIRLREDVLAKG